MRPSSSDWRCASSSPQRMPLCPIQRRSCTSRSGSMPNRRCTADTSSRSSTSATVTRPWGSPSSISSAASSGSCARLCWSAIENGMKRGSRLPCILPVPSWPGTGVSQDCAYSPKTA